MSEDKMTIERFVKKLAESKTYKENLGKPNDKYVDASLNIYNNSEYYLNYLKGKNIWIEDVKKREIWAKDVKKRQKNLCQYLKKMKGLKPNRLLIGEAPGINGCFGTGIPFTDINTLNTLDNPFINSIKSELHEDDATQLFSNCVKEDTSSIVWERLDQLHKKAKPLPLPLLWNIYPFHPATKETYQKVFNERKNKKPNAAERALGVDFLFDLLSLFEIKEIYAVGMVPYNTLNLKETSKELKNRGIELVKYIRHPAHGGKSDFIKGFNEIYRIEHKEPNNQKNRRIGRIRKIRIIGRIRRIGKIKSRKNQKNKQ